MEINNIENILIKKLPVNDKSKKLLNRRINKLKKDPVSFFEDSYNKRISSLKNKVSLKKLSNQHYTVISAAYNVENYVDKFFKSIINQSIDFKKHINIIIVDDGSTDRTAKKIKKWEKKFPKNIRYIYKDNGGQASARNLGLKYVESEWVTFIDADDFINFDYFLKVDKYILSNDNANLVVTNIYQFNEEKNIYEDVHPLRKKFNIKNNTIQINSKENYIQEAVSGTFVRKSLIDHKNIYFNEEIKPVLEDTQFISKYLLLNRQGSIGLVKDATYYHRKSDKYNLNLKWDNYDRFNSVFSNGLLDICHLAKQKLGFVPIQVQNVVLYYVSGLISQIVDNPEIVYFLDQNQMDTFLNTLDVIFTYIDTESILNYSFSNSLFYYKVGMLGAFKNETLDSSLQVAYIDSYDYKNNLFRARFFSNKKDQLFSFKFNNIETPILHIKIIEHNFINRSFAYEYIIWVKTSSEANNKYILQFHTDSKISKISLKGKKYKNLGKALLLNAFQVDPSKNHLKPEKWFFIDSDFKADDNAEHLYRYVLNNTEMKAENLYFGLNSDSHDWNRLLDEGFNLVDMKKDDCISYMHNSDKIISSNATDYIMNFDGKDSLVNKQFVFLQHGVIHNDLSKWLKSKKIDLFLTTTYGEYMSIIADNSNYFFTDKEVKLIGQPRYDSLLANNNPKKQILIMPTWRKDIVGKLLNGRTSVRELNPDFMDTEYAYKWQSLLSNPELEKLAKYYNYEIVYFPHANVQAYTDLFDIPEYISVITHETGSIQALFQQSALMITDYSSVVFEMAYLNKQVIYYQFDEVDFLSGAHTSKPSYFDYRDHGFGPVVTEESNVLMELEKVLINDGIPLEPYASRIKNTFAYHDTSNSQRAYEAIINLDNTSDKTINTDILYNMMLSAYTSKAWDLVEARSRLIIKNGNNDQRVWAKSLLGVALFHQNKFIEFLGFLNGDDRTLEDKKYWKAKVALATTRWQDAIELLESKTLLKDEPMLMLLFSYAELGKIAAFEKLKVETQQLELNEVQSIMIQAWSLLLYKQWEALIQLLATQLSQFSINDLRDFKPQLLIAQAHRFLANYGKSHQQLTNFEKHTTNDPRCRIEIAQLAFARGDYNKCIKQCERSVNGNINFLPEDILIQYVMSHWHMNNTKKLFSILPDIVNSHPQNSDFKVLYIRILAEKSEWLTLLEQADTLEQKLYADVIYQVTLARYRLGFIEDAYLNYIKPNNQHSYKYWHLISEIALLVDDIELAIHCYKGMISIYPNNDSSANWSKLNILKA